MWKHLEKGLLGYNKPAKFVLLRFVAQVPDKCGNSIYQATIPAGPGVWTQ